MMHFWLNNGLFESADLTIKGKPMHSCARVSSWRLLTVSIFACGIPMPAAIEHIWGLFRQACVTDRSGMMSLTWPGSSGECLTRKESCASPVGKIRSTSESDSRYSIRAERNADSDSLIGGCLKI